MRKFLFASHAYLAKGILSSLELIMGHQDNVKVLCAYTQDDFDIKQEIKNHIDALSCHDELIVVTDVLGGSVNNEFMSVLGGTDKNVYLVAGLNLALLMSMAARKDEDTATETLITECVEEAKETIVFCNTLLQKTEEPEDEEF
ncbi:PTS system fructose subfamily transporter subunit IIA [Clostridium sp. AF19-22AC]|jgi:fructoselysine and glucoselysine-specific PTS system IIA component|uniref:PTS sugar transporter subunit IIA n=1 Tax=Clostridia TaxID=186801 RepID=UPI000E4EF857|nr:MULTISPECIES: PTS system fructose subfamily transporter subunit IIA [Clostridia]RHR29884.1 PTS system fructose subfamily transporter subunit IIA [Clostridium sp. AF19-22AC]